MRRFILAGTAIAALAVPALAPALASADVQRYQTQEATLTSTVNWNGNVFVHQYNVDIACGSFTGTGATVGYGINENISGTINGSTVGSFDAAYLNGSAYTWSSNGTDSDGRQFTVTNALTNLHNTSDFKNHGAYVSSQGGGADAAHSCIGMPITGSN
jgi:hypothetical protein